MTIEEIDNEIDLNVLVKELLDSLNSTTLNKSGAEVPMVSLNVSDTPLYMKIEALLRALTELVESPIKRANFTNEEIKNIIEGQKLVVPDGEKPVPEVTKYNEPINDLLDFFSDLTELSPDTFGALALHTKSQTTVHIGKIPKEIMMQAKRNQNPQ